jgi:hypothetical protein
MGDESNEYLGPLERQTSRQPCNGVGGSRVVVHDGHGSKRKLQYDLSNCTVAVEAKCVQCYRACNEKGQ